MTTREAGSVVIVGGGLAGYSAADMLRTLGHSGPITMIDPEPSAYDRTPLSKTLFDVDFSMKSLRFADDDAMSSRSIATIFGKRVTSLDPLRASVALSDGSVLPADTVLLATGGEPRHLTLPGSDDPRILTLRTFSDAEEIRRRIRPTSRVAVIGAGLIGAEVASALVAKDIDVTLIDPNETPLIPALGQVMAEHLHGMHTQHRVRTIQGQVTSIGTDGDALVLKTEVGESILADFIVVGIGIIPNTSVAQAAGLDVNNGILVDEDYRTSSPKVFAAGDVARFRNGEGELVRREEHWDAAQRSGQAAARGMLGLRPSEPTASWFWSDRHGAHLEATGRLTGSGEVVVRPGPHPVVFLLDDERIVGAAAVNDSQTVRAARRLIDRRSIVAKEDLLNPDVSLRQLVRSTA